jgi:hypothetical protein
VRLKRILIIACSGFQAQQADVRKEACIRMGVGGKVFAVAPEPKVLGECGKAKYDYDKRYQVLPFHDVVSLFF